jgi:hypothetical protein
MFRAAEYFRGSSVFAEPPVARQADNAVRMIAAISAAADLAIATAPTAVPASMLMVEEEGTASTLQALAEVIGEHGLFCALYTDRGSHYFHTPKAGEKVPMTRTIGS